MTNPMIRKLEHGARLTAEDHATLLSGLKATRRLPPHATLIREGDPPDGLFVVLKGVVCRHKVLRDGERHIVALLLPGDFCDVHAGLLKSMDHGLSSLGPCVLTTVPRNVVSDWISRNATLRQAMNWAALVDEAILREWLVNLGARRAPQRMAHLFCELRARLYAVGEGRDGGFPLPLTQEELGQTLGLSVVHVNRTLSQLRQEGLATFRSGVVRIPDIDRLADFAGFSPAYLHLAPFWQKDQAAVASSDGVRMAAS